MSIHCNLHSIRAQDLFILANAQTIVTLYRSAVLPNSAFRARSRKGMSAILRYFLCETPS